MIDGKAYYAGSPEPLDSNDLGDHGIIIGEINESTKEFKILSLKNGKSFIHTYKYKINGASTEEDIVEIVVREVIKLGGNNIFKIKLTGLRNPDLELSRDMFSQK